MKNFLKSSKKSNEETDNSQARITNETVAEHREQVLAGGRKFKYPVQYQKYRLVINSIAIGVVTVVILTLIGWHQLYIAQNSSKLMYRITQLVPVTVASVDGEPVRYSDYLMRYRSSIYYLQQQNEINLKTDSGKRQAAFKQRQELDNAEKMAYVQKLARQSKVSVTSQEVDTFIKRNVDARSVSLNAYEKTVLQSFYDWSLGEYRSVVHAELLKRKVSFVIDTGAKTKAETLRQSIVGGADITTVAKESSDDDVTKATGGDSGDIPIDSQDTDGLIAEAKKLESGQLSGLIQGVDGYYFIKLISKSDSSVRFSLVKVNLTALDERFTALQKDGKIKEFITVEREQG